MPEPSKVSADLNALISSAVTLQSSNFTAIRYAVSLPDGASMAVLDPTMISQVLTNLLKNAAESVERKQQNEGNGFHGEIKVTLKVGEKDAKLTIADNGVGLPEDRTKLFEPYYTTRAEGTGLGLPIVKKIVEDHGGTLQLESADPFDGCTHQGAMAIIHLPLNETETIDGTK
jgi:two-component system nitrogen regulation sensor histidine kinase NtrY